ncbi:MAG: carbohydrate ABC transporter permease, partial [Chloroflexota bacterium]
AHRRTPALSALRWVTRVATAAMAVVLVIQALHSFGLTSDGFSSWRPVAYLLIAWFVLFDVTVYLTRGERGKQLVFILPALQITLALVIFPTLFGFVVAFTEWDLGSAGGRRFNGFDNFRAMAQDENFWNALGNNFKYLFVAVPVQYLIAFGVALLLNQQIRAQKFFRVSFLLPFMISPVAVGWMIGRSIMDANRGVLPNLLENLGLKGVSFFDQPVSAFLGIVAMDSWINVPFMMVMLLAGLQALPGEIFEAASIDGASGLRRFLDITFPLMLPVSLTAIVLRMIFEFKLVDVVRVVTNGGPGGATDTMSLYIYKEGVESTNVGYATAMAMVFLIVVLVVVSAFLVLVTRRVRDVVY